ncbi:MAG: hypothetical protein ABI379_11810 [Rhodanobacter sp.]
MLNLARILVLTTFALGLGVTTAFAQEATSTTPAATSQQTTQARAASADDKPLIKPGDPDCIRDTGSHIRAKPGHCLSVNGRSYSREELQRTGQIDTGRALLMLDPSITLGH